MQSLLPSALLAPFSLTLLDPIADPPFFFFFCSSIFSRVPTDAQLMLHLLRQRELLNNPLPRPPASATSAQAQKTLNDTSPLSDAHEQDNTSSVGDGDESHLVGDGEHDEDGKGPSKLKSKMLGFGKKLAAKGATFRGAGKVEVLPEGGKGPVSLTLVATRSGEIDVER